MDKDKIKKVEDRVKDMLESHPPTRDDDMKLYASIISRFYGHYLAEMTAKELLTSIYHSKVPHFTSILRRRQLLQQKNPELRGEKYEERQIKGEKVKEDIKTWDNEQSKLF